MVALNEDINSVYIFGARDILGLGFTVNTRGTVSKEILNSQHQFDLNNPLVVTLESRNLKPSYVLAEYLWYMSGSLQASDIAKDAPFWNTLKNEDGEIISNYGYWIFHAIEDFGDPYVDEEEFFTGSRFDYCVNLLKKDPQTRKAIINIHGVDNSSYNSKDTPCTLSLQFMIRDNRLHMIVNMRSNDFVIGWCNDIIQFQLIAWMMYSVLKFKCGMTDLKLGKYFHNAASLHIYDRHFDNIEKRFPLVNRTINEETEKFKYNLHKFCKDIVESTAKTSQASDSLTWLNQMFVPCIKSCLIGISNPFMDETDDQLLPIPLDDGSI